MRIAYLLVINLGVYDGVIQKIVSQINSWNYYGHEVQVFCITPDAYRQSSLYASKVKINTYVEGGKLKKAKNYLLDIFKLSKFHKKIEKDLNSFNPEIVYVRNTFYQPYIGRIVKQYIGVYEYNTSELKEYKLLAKTFFKYKIAYVYYLFFYKSFFKSFKGVSCVTYELEDEFKGSINPHVDTMVIPNAIDLEKEQKILKRKEVNKIPNLLFIGTPGANWHGLDAIEKLAEKTMGKLNFHIIGFENTNPVTSNITYHGFMMKEDYQKIFDMCDIGIGTVALYRKKMNEACPLKVREYLVNGLPIIICYEDTAFKRELPKWVIQLPNREDSLLNNYHKIIDFCNHYLNKRIKTEMVRPYIDSLLFEKKRLAFFEKILSEEN